MEHRDLAIMVANILRETPTNIEISKTSESTRRVCDFQYLVGRLATALVTSAANTNDEFNGADFITACQPVEALLGDKATDEEKVE